MKDYIIRKYHRFLVLVQVHLQSTNQDNLSAFTFSELLKNYLKLKKVDNHLKNMLDLKLIELDQDKVVINYHRRN